jgi:hypothetical protein
MAISRRWWIGALPPAAAGALGGQARPRSRSLEERLHEAIGKMPVVDSHEHIIPESERTSQRADFFTLAGHYALNDVISAGLGADAQKLARDESAPPERRWEAFEPAWNHARFTGYGQALRIAIRDIYGFEEISRATIGRIGEAIAAANKPGLYARVMRERAGIRYAVLDDYWNAAPVKPEGDLFALARKFDRFITPGGPKDVRQLEELTGVPIQSLGGLKRAMEKSFEQSLAAGMIAVKSTLAYNREIRFEEVAEPAAEGAFLSMVRGERPRPEGFRSFVERPFRQLEDHMFHHLMRLADAHSLPVQIHTGLLAGNGGFITNTDPTGLTNLFFLYPRLRFDLFHIGYPYQRELGVLAKLFPGVHVDFCWAHVIAPRAAREALHEYLETVPVNKVLGYGGDYRFPELSYAHLVMARRNIAAVLAARVEERFCTEEEAIEIARLMLDGNPARLFPRTRG